MKASRPTAVQYGVGPIGARIVELAIDRGIEFVGAIDVDPEKVGRDLGAVAGLDERLAVEITDDPATALAPGPDVVFHSTGSHLDAVRSQLETAFQSGADVVSTCEELAYPWRDSPDLGDTIDSAAAEAGVTCLGAGINPGFAMDLLPAVLTVPCQQIERIRVERVQNAGRRRGSLQEKIGVGLSPARFETTIAADGGHVGLAESAAMIAAAVGWDLTEIDETVRPVLADTAHETDHATVASGAVAGIRQRLTGTDDGDDRLTLELEMAVGATPRDRVAVEGTPSFEVTVEDGFHGDVTTPAVVVNVLRRVRAADPGLVTMLDLPAPTCHAING